MTTAVSNLSRSCASTPSAPPTAGYTRAAYLPITLEQYHQMIEKGILPEDSSVELLHGLLTPKDRSVLGEDPMGHSPLHKMVVSLLAALAPRINSATRHLQIQLPISVLPDHEPEPDGSVVHGTPRDYADRLAGPEDIAAVIEVAHASLERDTLDKLPIYAAAGIPQYVVINLRTNEIEVYTDPDTASARYRTKNTLGREQVLQLHLGDETLPVKAADLLP